MLLSNLYIVSLILQLPLILNGIFLNSTIPSASEKVLNEEANFNVEPLTRSCLVLL